MRSIFAIAFLAAAASAEVFRFVGHNGHDSAVYGVRGGVTVGSQQLTGEKTALEYNGTLVIEKVGEGEYLSKFTHFSLGKYDKINRRIQDETFSDLTLEEQRLVKAIREEGVYEREMQKPIKFSMKEGQVMRMEAEKEHRQWSLNIYRAVLTLLQNQLQKPANLAVPTVEYKYEDGITGKCKVQYEIFSNPEDKTVHGVYNMTKTKNYKQCLGRPVYLHLKDVHRGCAGVCDNHRPENFLDQYEEEKTDFEMKPTPGCPVDQQVKDSLVSFETIAKYNVSKGFLDEARSESVDVFHLFGGRIQVFSRLQLRLLSVQGTKLEQPANTNVYETLQQRLPDKHAHELDIPVYALMKEYAKHHEYPQYFHKHFEAVIRELHQLQGNQKQGQKEQQGFNTPAYIVELIQAISGMDEEELRKTMPNSVLEKQPENLSEEQQLRRQIWIELLGKAGSKTAVKMAVLFIKQKIFTPTEVRRVLQDIAAFQSYPDTDMIEETLGLCIQGQGLTGTGRATACVAAGKIISKACNSKVHQGLQNKEGQQRQQFLNGQEPDSDTKKYETTMGHLAIKPQLRCTPEKLQQYIQRLTQTLNQATDFKQIVALINGLAKVEKPEVLPELIRYVRGTAPNMHRAHEQGDDQDEDVEFMRRVAILSLRNIATKYPKEVNPIVRVIYLNTTERVPTRLNAFDIWMNTQPAQWEIEKVMQVANKDSSLDLTHFVYTALKTAMHAKEPCYQLLAQRIRTAWGQIRPVDLGMKFSQLRSKSYYNTVEHYGVRGIWRMIASNTTIMPAFTQAKLEQVRGPFMQTLLGAKFLVKGGNKVWEGLVGKDGLLERISQALNGQTKSGHRQHDAKQLLKDIAQGMDNQEVGNQTPKAVLFWRFFAGEAIVPIDRHYVQELMRGLSQTMTKIGGEGISGHIVRVLVPTKSFHVEPTPIGLPIVHSTIHPIVISVRYENLKLRYDNLEGRFSPKTFEITGTIHPTILSFRQSRVFVAEREGQPAPTMKISDIKELNLKVNFRVGYELTERRFRVNINPEFERLFHTGLCAELKLENNTILDEEPRSKLVDYAKCIKTMQQPIRRDLEIGGRKTGMVLRFRGESHQPWSGLGMLGSSDFQREGFLGTAISYLNNGMKHHAMSLYLEADKQQPVNEWSAIIDTDSNFDQLAELPIRQQTEKAQNIKVQYKPRRDEMLDSELQQVLRKVEQLLHNAHDRIRMTTLEEQMLIKIEGLYQGEPKRTIKVAMKKIHDFGNTEQYYALVAEHQQSRQGIEIFAKVSYPAMRSPFYYDPNYFPEDERVDGTLIAKFQGQQQEQVYRVKFQAVKSDEQKQKSEYEWFEVRCLADQKVGITMSHACRKAILKQHSLDRMEVNIELPQNVDVNTANFAYKALDTIKYKFYPKMQTQIAGREEREQNPKLHRGNKEIRISADAIRESAWSLLYNVRIEMPLENVTFSRIRLPGLRPLHMQVNGVEQLKNLIPELDHTCTITERSVQTFDNVTFNLDVHPGCYYVATRDQSNIFADYTVTLKVLDPETFKKNYTVEIEDHVIVLQPFDTYDTEFNITVDDETRLLSFGQPMTFAYGHFGRTIISAFPYNNTPGNPSVVLLSTYPNDFSLLFNGRVASISVVSRYKGRTIGICGHNDDNKAHEFIGPDRTEYNHSSEFIASYAIGKECSHPVNVTGKKRMEKFETELTASREQESQRSEHRRSAMQSQGEPNQHWNEMLREEMFGPYMTLVQHQQHHGNKMESALGTVDSQEIDQGDRQVLKTYVSSAKGNPCFSTEPVPSCKPGYHKQGILRTEDVELICVARNNEAAMQAMQDVRQGKIVDTSVLEQYQKQRLSTRVNVPKCQRYD